MPAFVLLSKVLYLAKKTGPVKLRSKVTQDGKPHVQTSTALLTKEKTTQGHAVIGN